MPLPDWAAKDARQACAISTAILMPSQQAILKELESGNLEKAKELVRHNLHLSAMSALGISSVFWMHFFSLIVTSHMDCQLCTTPSLRSPAQGWMSGVMVFTDMVMFTTIQHPMRLQ